MPTLKVNLSIGFPGADQEEEVEIDGDEWDECETDAEREKLINDYAKEWAWGHIEISAEILRKPPAEGADCGA